MTRSNELSRSRWKTRVLNLSLTPPAPRLGGVEAQLNSRRAEEAKTRTVALLFPWRGRWRLEIEAATERRSVDIGPASPASPLELEDSLLTAATRKAATLVEAQAVHLENTYQAPWRSLRDLADDGLRLLLSIHDFSPFCPRPQLLEEPDREFCRYCRDLARCDHCLGQSWDVKRGFQGSYRRLGSRVFGTADALIFPSHFLERQFGELVPEWDESCSVVIPPGTSARPVPGSPPAEPLRQIAFVGGDAVHKGARIFEALLADRRWSGNIRWTVYGGASGSGTGSLPRLRKRPEVSVRGYYRWRSLPQLLRTDGIQIALLLSTWPETFSLALSECLLARVPVVAFARGALEERVQPDIGILVDAESEPGAVGDLLADLVTGRAALPVLTTPTVPSAEKSAAEYSALYRDLGLVP